MAPVVTVFLPSTALPLQNALSLSSLHCIQPVVTVFCTMLLSSLVLFSAANAFILTRRGGCNSCLHRTLGVSGSSSEAQESSILSECAQQTCTVAELNDFRAEYSRFDLRDMVHNAHEEFLEQMNIQDTNDTPELMEVIINLAPTTPANRYTRIVSRLEMLYRHETTAYEFVNPPRDFNALVPWKLVTVEEQPWSKFKAQQQLIPLDELQVLGIGKDLDWLIRQYEKPRVANAHIRAVFPSTAQLYIHKYGDSNQAMAGRWVYEIARKGIAVDVEDGTLFDLNRKITITDEADPQG